MKKFITTLFLSSIVLILAGQEQNKTYYQLNCLKFKHGSKDAAINMGMELYAKTTADLGIDNYVFKAETGYWDLYFISARDNNNPFVSIKEKEFLAKMTDIAGSPAELEEQQDHINSLVAESQVFYMERKTPDDLDPTQYYRMRKIKCVNSNKDMVLDTGMKLFNQLLKNHNKSNIVFDMFDGDFHILVIEPVSNTSPFVDDHAANIFQDLIQIAGSEEILMQDLKNFNDNVVWESLEYLMRMPNQ